MTRCPECEVPVVMVDGRPRCPNGNCPWDDYMLPCEDECDIPGCTGVVFVVDTKAGKYRCWGCTGYPPQPRKTRKPRRTRIPKPVQPGQMMMFGREQRLRPQPRITDPRHPHHPARKLLLRLVTAQTMPAFPRNGLKYRPCPVAKLAKVRKAAR